MPHFELEEWTDFVRGVVRAADGTAMREHLASGCAECGRSFALFQKVLAAAQADSRYEVPETWVRQAQAIAFPPAQGAMDLRPVLSRLIYDSFRDPVPAGLRSGDRTSRQVVYAAGEYSVDLCLERGPGQLRLSVVGQVANGSKPNESAEGLPILLFSGDRVLTSDLSNAFGEFQLDARYSPHLRLCVLMYSLGNRIELPLPPLFGRQEYEGGLL